MKKFIIIIFIIILALAGAGYFYWGNKSSVSTDINSGGDVKGAQTELTDFKNDLFDTKLNSDFILKNQTSSANAATTRQFVFSNNNPYFNGQIAITIGIDKTHQIDDVSGVKLRQINSDDYTQTSQSGVLNTNNYVFNKLSSYEKSVFWVDNGYQVSVVASGGAENKSILEDNLEKILKNWKWL